MKPLSLRTGILTLLIFVALALVFPCTGTAGPAQSNDAIAKKIKTNLKAGDPATKMLKVMGRPDYIQPYLDMTIYFYGDNQIHCYNVDFMNGEINKNNKFTTLSRVEKQEIAWFKLVAPPKKAKPAPSRRG